MGVRGRGFEELHGDRFGCFHLHRLLYAIDVFDRLYISLSLRMTEAASPYYVKMKDMKGAPSSSARRRLQYTTIYLYSRLYNIISYKYTYIVYLYTKKKKLLHNVPHYNHNVAKVFGGLEVPSLALKTSGAVGGFLPF